MHKLPNITHRYEIMEMRPSAGRAALGYSTHAVHAAPSAIRKTKAKTKYLALQLQFIGWFVKWRC